MRYELVVNKIYIPVNLNIRILYSTTSLDAINTKLKEKALQK